MAENEGLKEKLLSLTSRKSTESQSSQRKSTESQRSQRKSTDSQSSPTPQIGTSPIEDTISISPITPTVKTPVRTAAAPPKPQATPIEAAKDQDVVEELEFNTFGTSPDQEQLIVIRRNERHAVKSAQRKQRLVQKDDELTRQEQEIKRLNEELAKAEQAKKDKVEFFKNMVAKQAKDAKERETEKDSKIA